MEDRIPAEVELAWDSFHQVVNMTSEELRAWLLTEAAGEAAGEAADGAAGEAAGQETPRDEPGLGLPELGAKVVDLLRKRKVDLTAQDADVMERVVDFVLDREASPPPAGPADDEWRRSLMTVGHDPLRP